MRGGEIKFSVIFYQDVKHSRILTDYTLVIKSITEFEIFRKKNKQFKYYIGRYSFYNIKTKITENTLRVNTIALLAK